MKKREEYKEKLKKQEHVNLGEWIKKSQIAEVTNKRKMRKRKRDKAKINRIQKEQ